MDDDGAAYYYWGQFRSHAVKLNADMVSFDQEKVIDCFFTEEEHFFHEGSSMRKIGDTYYAVFADIERGKPTSLGYETSKSPLGPFQYQGILIDNEDCDPSSWNNHGFIECFQGKLYIFYHRSSRNTKIFRRMCVEPITINEDGTIDEVVMTSQGIGEPFGPGERIMGYQACGLKGLVYIDAVSDIDGEPAEALVNIANQDRAVFRYVRSEKGFTKAEISSNGQAEVIVRLNGQKAGRILITRDGKNEVLFASICASEKEQELELEFRNPKGFHLNDITLF